MRYTVCSYCGVLTEVVRDIDGRECCPRCGQDLRRRKRPRRGSRAGREKVVSRDER